MKLIRGIFEFIVHRNRAFALKMKLAFACFLLLSGLRLLNYTLFNSLALLLYHYSANYILPSDYYSANYILKTNLFCFIAGVCQTGGWCDGRNFNPCSPGTYNPHIGKGSPTACIDCPPGYYCTGPGVSNYTTFICQQGYYCPKATKYKNEFPCPAGTYNSNTSSTALAEACKPCPAGYYCPQASPSATSQCPMGYYCPEGTGIGTRFACPLGTYSSQLGLVNGSQCVDCPVGHYCPDGSQGAPSVAPMPCPPGTYNPYTKTGYRLNCAPCDAGMSCPRAAQNASTDPCKEGYYCPNGTITNTQFPCPPGTYTNSTNLTRAENCDPCPRGFSCGWATGFPTNPWQHCQQGHYCPQGKLHFQFLISTHIVGGTLSAKLSWLNARAFISCLLL